MSSAQIYDMELCKITQLHERKHLKDNFHEATLVVETGRKITVEMFGKDVEVDEVHIWSFISN